MQDESIDGFRLSPQQKRLWQLQAAGNNQPYRAHCAVLIEGNLNLEILKLALQDVINRHEILRTTFRVLEGMNLPLQAIGNCNISNSFQTNFLEEQTINIELLLQEAAKRHFDWNDSLLLEISLVIVDQEKAVLLIGFPSLLGDWVTLNNLVCEISRSYAACLQDEKRSDEPLQYADIAEWQNELFEGEEGKIAKEYWQNPNKKILTNYRLPLEKQPTVKAEFNPTFISLELNPDTIAQLDAIAQNYNTSISILLQACWCILLWRLTGQSDVVIGTYCDGRDYEELDSALGLLAKYLPIYSALEETFKFSEILKQTREATEEAFKWQESFTWEQNENFFPVGFEFEEQPATYAAANVSFSIQRQYVCLDRFKIKLSCLRRDDSLIAEFHYDANLFQVEDIERIARQFQTLLESAINQPEAAIGELEILSASEQHQLLIEFNNTQTEYSKHQCIHQLFEDWTAKTP
ncbi:MAG TPA: condensation domain-containing protein, partial [Oculatellaceae cyanobacterium]